MRKTIAAACLSTLSAASAFAETDAEAASAALEG